MSKFKKTLPFKPKNNDENDNSSLILDKILFSTKKLNSYTLQKKHLLKLDYPIIQVRSYSNGVYIFYGFINKSIEEYSYLFDCFYQKKSKFKKSSSSSTSSSSSSTSSNIESLKLCMNLESKEVLNELLDLQYINDISFSNGYNLLTSGNFSKFKNSSTLWTINGEKKLSSFIYYIINLFLSLIPSFLFLQDTL